MLRKLILGFLLTFLFGGISLLTPTLAHAQLTQDPTSKAIEDFCNRRKGPQMNLETWYAGSCDDPNNIGFSQIVLLDLYGRLSGSNTINWSNPTDIIKKLISEKDGKLIATLPSEPIKTNGITGQVSSFISMALSSPPVTLENYIADVRQNMQHRGIVQPAYAQGTGFGFQNLLPILPIWKAFRNVAYFVFILVFVLYGFMIMFRMKINPQNVATFQTAIPKIVITLLLITFAYAIAGFMIDLMFVVFNLILSVFQVSGIITSPDNLAIKMGSGQAGIIPSFLFSTVASFFFVPSALINVLTQLPGIVSIAIDFLLSVSGLGIIVRIIILIAIGYSYVKLLFKLFEAYITVIIQVIFSPIILLQDVLPGSNAFGNWLRNIAANLSVFPTTMVMFLLSYIFLIQPLFKIPLIGGAIGAGLGAQDLTGTASGFSMPLIGGLAGGHVAAEGILAVIGFFIVLMASKYVDMVRDALKVPPFKYGTALGEALQFGYGAQRGAFGEEVAARMPGSFGRAYRWSRGALESAGGAMGAFQAPKQAQKVQVITPSPTFTPPTSP